MNLELQTISEISAEPVQFLSAPYIPLGKIVILQGDPGLGKTTIALSFAAALTTGTPLPWDAKPFGVCDVIFQSMEDGYGDTIKPRLEQLGANCDRVHVIREDEYPVTLGDDRLEQAIIKTNAKLLVLDPLAHYMGAEMSGAGVRPIMTDLMEMAKRTNCTILLISHLNKKGGKAQYRGLGAIDISAVARSVLTVGKLPDDEEIRILLHNKSNLAPCGVPQAYGFDEVSGLTWLGEYMITLEELLSGKIDKSKQPKVPSQLELAKQIIIGAINNGITAAAEIKTLVEDRGISRNTLDRAKSALAVKSVKTGDNWQWELPSLKNEEREVHQDPQDSVCRKFGDLGVVEITEELSVSL